MSVPRPELLVVERRDRSPLGGVVWECFLEVVNLK